MGFGGDRQVLRRARSRAAWWLLALGLIPLASCHKGSSGRTAAGQWQGGATPGQWQGGTANPGGYPAGGYPAGGYPAGGGYPAPSATAPGTPPPATTPPAAWPFPWFNPGGTVTTTPATTPALPSVPGLPVANDPINAVDMQWLRNRSGAVMAALINALPAAPQARVKGIPYFADTTVGEVNAYAGCDDQGLPLMAITDGLLEVEAYMAQLKATDEVFGTQKLKAYTEHLAQTQRPGQPIVKPQAGLVDPAQHVDSRKVTRQAQIFDEQVAFVLGHELAHHHLGHTGCANGQGGSRGVTPQDFGRILSRALPVFNQQNEITADVAGTQNVLRAGASQKPYVWTEGGAVLTLQFFAALDQLTPASIVFAFESTHPHPLLRLPIVQQTATNYRATGGVTLGIPGLGL